VGWAEPPRYHKDEHKLYWAKELDARKNVYPIFNFWGGVYIFSPA